MSSRSLAFPALALLLSLAPAAAQSTVSAIVETTPVASVGDAADDIAIWVHPTQSALSLVIATDKQAGLVVYDLAGTQLQFLPDGRMNNVDLRDGFPLGDENVTLVTCLERDAKRLAIYAIDPVTRSLRDVAARDILLGMRVYGCCMYRSPVTGDTYVFATSEAGDFDQWRLFEDATGTKVDAELVRSIDVGSQSEGCVADDENQWVFLGEENVGIWRYGAEPDDGDARVAVDTTDGTGHLEADV
jgi:3-phytase